MCPTTLDDRCDNCLHSHSMHQEIGRKVKRLACFHEDEHGMCPCEEFESGKQEGEP